MDRRKTQTIIRKISGRNRFKYTVVDERILLKCIVKIDFE